MIEAGDKINSWTYIQKADNPRYGLFRCDCGEEKRVFISSVINETSKCCGHCARNRYGLSKEDYNAIIYARRRAMMRCYNPKTASFKRYGGRGIKVCDEWLESQDAFIKWSLANGWRKELSLDRIDNDKDYSPTNCRWATAKEQANNRSNCIYIVHDGMRKTMMEWCEELGIPHWLPNNRWRRGERDFSKLFDTTNRETGAVLYY